MAKKKFVFGGAIVLALAILAILAGIIWIKQQQTPLFLPGVDFYNLTVRYPSPCTGDSVCVSVKADCCGCNAGGKATAVNNQSLGAWNSMVQSNCGGRVCATVMSGDRSCSAEPRCVNGYCELVNLQSLGQICGGFTGLKCAFGLACDINGTASPDRTGLCVNSFCTLNSFDCTCGPYKENTQPGDCGGYNITGCTTSGQCTVICRDGTTYDSSSGYCKVPSSSTTTSTSTSTSTTLHTTSTTSTSTTSTTIIGGTTSTLKSTTTTTPVFIAPGSPQDDKAPMYTVILVSFAVLSLSALISYAVQKFIIK